MSKAQHTPGPWIAETANKYGEIRITASATKTLTFLIALTSPDCPDLRTQEANTSLIAAAPDLLAACEEVSGCIKEMPEIVNYLGQPVIDRLRAAIAKAKGTA